MKKTMQLGTWMAMAALAISLTGWAQEEEKKGWQYKGLLQGGLVAGANGAGYQVQTVQGLYKHRWFTGITTGYDSYQMPGALLGLQGSYALSKGPIQPYVLAQAGPFLPIRRGIWDTKLWGNDTYLFDLQTGWWAQGGAGMALPWGKKGKQLHLSALYSIKQGNYIENSWFWIGPMPWPQTSPSSAVQNRLTMHRVLVQAGISW